MHMTARETMARALYPMFYGNPWDRGSTNLKVTCLERVDKLLAALRAQGHSFATEDIEHQRIMAQVFNKRLHCNGCPNAQGPS
jgi:hypothetical protein